MIIFAVLVALGVDEYWESLEQQELADVALHRIAAEVVSNRDEVLSSRVPNLNLQSELRATLRAVGEGEPFSLSSVEFDVALLGDDAWQTARTTQAVHFMDFDQVGRIARVYRLQSLYEEQRAPAIDAVAALGSSQDDFLSFLRPFARRLDVTLDVECDLLDAYDDLRAELSSDVPAISAAGCTR